MRERRYSTWKQLLIFALAGPPVGSLVLFFASEASKQPIAQLPLGLLFWLSLTLPMAYLIGLVPALAAGAAGALARARAPAISPAALAVRFSAPLVAGGVASLAFPMLLLSSEPEVSSAAVGAVAALVCTAWVEWRSSVRPNSSSKPTPLRGAA